MNKRLGVQRDGEDRKEKTYPCPVPRCPCRASYVGFSVEEVLLRQDQDLNALIASATASNNVKAPVQRVLSVRCPVHGERFILKIGNHVTGTRKRKRTPKGL